jgi:hypothetical protein
MSDRLTKLDAASASLSNKLNQRTQQIASLEAGLASANAQLAGRPASRAGALAEATSPAPPQPRIAEALVRLEEAARGGVSFASEQGQLASLAPLDPDIAALASIAREGAPNLEQLRRSFEALAAPIEREITRRTGDDGLNWMRTALTGVALERADGLAPLVATRAALVRGEPKAIPADLPPAFAAWREGVGRRRRLDAVLERLHARQSGQ